MLKPIIYICIFLFFYSVAISQQWSVEKANQWYRQQPYMVACNYTITYADDAEEGKIISSVAHESNLDSQFFILPTAERSDTNEWLYTTSSHPHINKEKGPSLLLNDWRIGKAGFGYIDSLNASFYPNIHIHTPWSTGDIYLVKKIIIPTHYTKAQITHVYLRMLHKGLVSVWINGKIFIHEHDCIASNNNYISYPIPIRFLKQHLFFYRKDMTIIIHCHKNNPQTYIDAGIYY